MQKNNQSGSTSFSNNGIQNAKQLSKVNKHNLRDYDNNKDDICIIYGTENLYQDVIDLYNYEFEEARIEYNAKQTREDRKIDDYFKHISQDKQKDLACEFIIEQFKTKENITEELKASNQLEWVQAMNNIKNRVEEIIYSELIYK